jgi:hypothetical protein
LDVEDEYLGRREHGKNKEEKYLQLLMNLPPVLTMTSPFLRDIHHCQI